MPRLGWASPLKRAARTGPELFDARGYLARQMGIPREDITLVAGPLSTYRGEDADYRTVDGATVALRLGPAVKRGSFGDRRRRVTATWRSRMETLEIDGDALVSW